MGKSDEAMKKRTQHQHKSPISTFWMGTFLHVILNFCHWMLQAASLLCLGG